jgi:sec-independent protein translocase protein TatA
MLPNIGTGELLAILVIVVILFGATRLPQIGEGIGKAIRNFKKAMSEPDEIDVTPKSPLPDDKNSAKDAKKS